MRNELYLFRHSKRFTQSAMARTIGCSRATYAAVENGDRAGSGAFWTKLQKAFGIADAEIGGLMKVDEETKNNRPID